MLNLYSPFLVSLLSLGLSFGFLTFEPLSTSASSEDYQENKPFSLPEGFEQSVVSDETRLNIYSSKDKNDMLTLNETGPNAGQYLYRTHEVRPRGIFSSFKGAAVSVIHLPTGDATLLAQRADWEAIDGLVWTPWSTLLVAEETQKSKLKDPKLPHAERGHVYEIQLDVKDKTQVKQVYLREQLGALAHEGIEFDDAGNIYLVDEDYHGSIYKFVPSQYGDLSDGQLYALKLLSDNKDRTGKAEWVPLNMKQAILNANKAAQAVNATTWCRPEDLERIKSTLYVALTCHANSIRGQRLENRVLSISLNAHPNIKNFVQAGVNVPLENNDNPKGFAKPDNLANGPDNTLWIVEDNSPSDIWVAYPDNDNDGYADKVELFASLTDFKAEATGIYFDAAFKNLFVNAQHTASGNDKTLKIYPVKP